MPASIPGNLTILNWAIATTSSSFSAQDGSDFFRPTAPTRTTRFGRYWHRRVPEEGPTTSPFSLDPSQWYSLN